MGLLLWSWLCVSVGFFCGAAWCAGKAADKVVFLEDKIKAMKADKNQTPGEIERWRK